MKSLLLPLTLAAAAVAAPAFADCTAPTINVTVPDGAKATKEDMVATQKTLKELNAAVSDFTSCLQSEKDAKIAAGGDGLSDSTRQKIAAEYNTRSNAVIDKLQKVADKFNLEVRAFKAKQPAN
jgi:opacity protein-like surface antigen